MRKVIGWLLGLSLVFAFMGFAWAGVMTSNQFFYKPSLGSRGQTEKNSYDSGLDRVDARLGKEIWVGDPLYGGTIQAAITAIGTTKAILHIPAGTSNVATDLTIPANIALKPERCAILTIANTKTLTINGPLEAGLYQIFSCTGTGKVVFGANSAKQLHPVWWGSAGDGVTDDTVPLRAAATALAGGKTLVISDSHVVRNNADTTPCILITGQDRVSVIGQGGKIKLANGNTQVSPVLKINTCTNVTVDGVEIDGNKAGVTTGHFGLWIYDCTGIKVENCKVYDAYQQNIVIENSYDIRCVNNYADGALWDNFHFVKSERLNIVGNHSSNCGDIGFDLDCVKDATIVGNTSKGNSAAGFSINNSQDTSYISRNIVLSGNVANGNGLPGFSLYINPGTGNIQNVSFSGDSAYGNQYGFSLQGDYISLAGVVAVENTQGFLNDNGGDSHTYVGLIGKGGYRGINITQSVTNLIIQGGKVSNITWGGLTFHSGVVTGKIRGIVIDSCGTGLNLEDTAATTGMGPGLSIKDVSAKNISGNVFEYYPGGWWNVELEVNKQTTNAFNSTTPGGGFWKQGDICWATNPSGGAAPGSICVDARDTTIRVQANAGATTIEVVSTTGMAVNDRIVVALDNGAYHYTTVATIVDGDTLTVNAAIPTGRTATVGAAVHTNRWKAMANLAS